MKLSESSYSEIKSFLTQALNEFCHPGEQSVVTDIHIMPIHENGEITVCDDDHDLASAQFIELSRIPYDAFYKVMEQELTRLLHQMNKETPFDKLAIWKPFSFVLVDDERETVAELMLVDDDTTLLNHSLMEGLDDELNDFLKDLLE